MTSKAEKLLQKMRQSKSGWKRKDLDCLYQGFGFIITPGSSHDIVKHPQYPLLRATLPRHAEELAKVYINLAVKQIDELLTLRKECL